MKASAIIHTRPIHSGWIAGISHVPSPNFSLRPTMADVSLIVVHNISLPPRQFGTGDILRFFQNQLDYCRDPFYQQIKDLRVSAHFFINRAGEITQLVATCHRAWHAGVSSYKNRNNCNDYSIGIELEGDDDSPFEESQLRALANLSRRLIAIYPAVKTPQGLRITGHADISPRRKTDPGPYFDWQGFSAEVGSVCLRS